MTLSLSCFVGVLVLLVALPAQGARLERLAVASAAGRHVFAVEVVREAKARDRGLMNRHSLGRDRGMLFVYDPPTPVWFWMDKTYIALDMLFIAADGRIISITENAKPLDRSLIPSGGAVRAVLEVRAGTAKRLGIVEGDRVLHPVFEQLAH